MQIKQTHQNNISFSAKFYPYPKSITDRKILNKFEEKTKDFPNLILLQDDISFFDKDHFFLMEGNKVLKFKAASYTNNRAAYTTVDKIVDRFVEIFYDLLKK